MYRGRNRRGNSRGGVVSLRQSERQFHRSMNPRSRAFDVNFASIVPPEECLTIRGMRWVRVAESKPATGTWEVRTSNIVKAALTGAASSSSIFLHRIRVYNFAEDAAQLLIGVCERPGITATTGGGPTTRYASRGQPGVSIACVGVELGRLWKEYALQQADTTSLVFQVLNTTGTALVVDALVDCDINLSNFNVTSTDERDTLNHPRNVFPVGKPVYGVKCRACGYYDRITVINPLGWMKCSCGGQPEGTQCWLKCPTDGPHLLCFPSSSCEEDELVDSFVDLNI